MRLRLTCTAGGDIRLQCLRDVPDKRRIDTGDSALLVCSSKLQEMTTPAPKIVPAGFGRISSRNRLSAYAKNVIREVGSLLDNGPLRNLVFLTGTLPGSSPEALAAISAWSGWIVQAVSQFLRDRFGTPQYFGVWEYQRRGALHLHLCVRTRNAQEAQELKAKWKARWIRLLDSVGKRAQVDMYARADGGTWAETKWITRTDAQTVEKSVSAYLSKYLGKGSGKVRGRCEYPPSAWWFASLTLRREARSVRREVTVPLLHLGTSIELFEKLGSLLAASMRSCFSYVSPYDCQIKGLIGLGGPILARMVWDVLADNLRPLAGGNGSTAGCIISAVDYARIVFQCLPRPGPC